MLNNHIERWDRFSVETLEKLSQEHEVEVTKFSGDWIVRLQKGTHTRYIYGLDWGLNNSVAKRIASDKCATYDVLTLENVPAVSHKLFLQSESLGNSGDHWENIESWFIESDQNVVCKPNASGGGRDVTHVTGTDTLKQTTGDLFTRYRAITISPYVDIQNEYRVTVLDGEALLSYEKTRSDEEEFRFNLSNGARATDIDPSVHDEIIALALKAADAIDITFANVDVIRTNNELLVLEINSDVTFKHYVEQGQKEHERAYAVYERAFKELGFFA